MKATRLRESESRSLRIQAGESNHVHVPTYYTISGPSSSTCPESRTRVNPPPAVSRQLVELGDFLALSPNPVDINPPAST